MEEIEKNNQAIDADIEDLSYTIPKLPLCYVMLRQDGLLYDIYSCKRCGTRLCDCDHYDNNLMLDGNKFECCPTCGGKIKWRR